MRGRLGYLLAMCLAVSAFAATTSGDTSTTTSSQNTTAVPTTVDSLFSDSVDVHTLLAAAGVAPCAHHCLSDLFYATRSVLSFSNPINNFMKLCNAYSRSQQCVAAQKNDCIDETVFQIATSGIEKLCKEEKEELNKEWSCLHRNAEMVLRVCDNGCRFGQTLSAVSRNEETRNIASTDGGDYRSLLQTVGPFCESAGCMSSCVSVRLDNLCPGTGSILMESILYPIVRIAQMIDELGDSARRAVLRMLPPQCHLVLDQDLILGLVRNTSDPTSEKILSDRELSIILHQTIHQWNILITKEKSLAVGKTDNKKENLEQLPIQREIGETAEQTEDVTEGSANVMEEASGISSENELSEISATSGATATSAATTMPETTPQVTLDEQKFGDAWLHLPCRLVEELDFLQNGNEDDISERTTRAIILSSDGTVEHVVDGEQIVKQPESEHRQVTESKGSSHVNKETAAHKTSTAGTKWSSENSNERSDDTSGENVVVVEGSENSMMKNHVDDSHEKVDDNRSGESIEVIEGKEDTSMLNEKPVKTSTHGTWKSSESIEDLPMERAFDGNRDLPSFRRKRAIVGCVDSLVCVDETVEGNVEPMCWAFISANKMVPSPSSNSDLTSETTVNSESVPTDSTQLSSEPSTATLATTETTTVDSTTPESLTPETFPVVRPIRPFTRPNRHGTGSRGFSGL